jgi:hypothetical protein
MLRAALVIVGLLSPTFFVVGLVLWSSDVRADGAFAEPVCGSAFRVMVDGDAYGGGEFRPDQEEFDAACVSPASNPFKAGLALGVVGAIAGVGAGTATLLGLRRSSNSATWRLAR